MIPRVNRGALARLSEGERREAEGLLAELDELYERNPLWKLRRDNAKQLEFLAAQTRIVAAFAGNRFGKCLQEDELVRMADGSVKPIREIEPGEYVVGVNLDGSTAPARVLARVEQGVKDVYRFRFSKRGAEASFQATLDHKMLARPECSSNRILPAGDVASRWVAQRATGFEAQTSGPDEDLAAVFGLLLGDGHVGRAIQFTNTDEDILGWLRSELPRGYDLAPHGTNPIQFYIRRPGLFSPSPLKAKLREHGIAVKSYEKRIPDVVWSWSNAAVAKLLAGLLLTDGTVTRCDGVWRVAFASASRELAEGTRQLLEERFGVFGSTVHAKDREGRRTEFSFSIGNYGSLCRLLASVPLVGVKLEKLRAAVKSWSGKRSDGAGLIFRGHAHIGRRQCYDICIDNETHLFALANGLVVSNTTALIVRTLIECLDEEWVPDWLRPMKRWHPGRNTVRRGVQCRLVAETNQSLHSVILPAFWDWCPRQALRGGKFEKAYNKQLGVLYFENGSFVDMKTYNQEAADFEGAALHFVGYDEPPPQEIRQACQMRLTDFQGYEMFAMTPLKSNTGWVRREIWRNREDPNITVVKGSIHDNKALDPDEVEFRLASAPNDAWRRAREFGDFVDIGGLIYPEFERCVVEKPFDPEFVRSLDVVVGIDPGIRNAAFVWVGFDDDNVAYVFDELLLQDKPVPEYVRGIQRVNNRWGVREDDVYYVIDPSSRARAMVNAETVQMELMREGVFANAGQNPVEGGIQQIRTRMHHKRFHVSPECRGLRDEADEYAAEDREDGKFAPIKGHDHRLDALRYAVMERVWDPIAEMDEPIKVLGYQQDFEPAWQPEEYV